MNDMKMNFTKLMVALCVSSVISLKAQQNIAHDGHSHEYVDAIEQKLNSVQHNFNVDSLRGFNESAAWQQAGMTGAPEWEQKIQVSVAKRRYINTKYGVLTFGKSGGGDPEVQSPCTNVNFETGTVAGWTLTEGTNSNSLTQAGCCPTASTRYSLATPGTDPTVPALQRVPVGTGNYTLKLGDGATTGGYAVKAKQTFSVTAANSVFIYQFAVVLEDPVSNAHACSEQAYFNISFLDGSNNPIPCGDYNVVNASSGCSAGGDPSFATYNSGGLSYQWKNWTTRAFDLTAYIGQNVTIEFIASDCSLSGHAGWAYVDASCQPMTLNLNGNEIPVGQTNNSFCGASTTNTLCAPSGFTYSWTGPGVTGQTGQCINTSSIGTFSVTLGQTGASCFSPSLYSTFNSVPNPTVSASLTQPICALPAGTATMNITGGTGPYSYSWTPAAPSTSVNTNLPAGSSYSVSVEDANGCIGSTSFSINPYPPAPDYTLSVVPGYTLSCSTPSVTITFAPTNTNTANQWQGPLGAITGSNVVVTTPGVYTYTTINTVSTCSLTGSINISGTLNLPVLTSTLTQPSCSSPVGSATLSVANGTGPFTYSWTPGTVMAPADTVNTNLPPGSNYTVAVTDNLGCTGLTTFSINNFSGVPSYTLDNTGLVLSCSSPTTSLTFAPTNTNTSTSWQGPLGVISATNTVVNSAGTYTYSALNTVSTCTLGGTFTITMDTIKPTATFVPTCNTNTITLTGTASPGINLGWTAPTTPATSLGNPAVSTAIGIYTLTVTNPANGCIQTYTASTFVPPITVATFPTTNVLTCTTNTITATTTPAATSSLVVTWNNGVTTSTLNPYPITASGTYTTVVQVVNGCSSQSVITVSTNTVANVNIIPTSTLVTCATGSVNLTAVSSMGGPYSYSWTPSVSTYTGTQFPVTAGGIYTVVALNTANGCTTTATQAIGMETINASFIADVYQGQMPLPVSFTNTSSNPAGTNYTWDFGDGHGLASNDTTVSHLYNTQGNFPVVLTAQNGFCRDTATRYIKVDLISVFEVPNVFTPNGDGKNDVFTFRAINMGEINLTIFDRWGLKMFESTDTGNVKWDGKNKGGSTVTDGTYFYIIKATGLDDAKYDLKGTVNVFQ
jgi:gliding motility-associated-like protein